MNKLIAIIILSLFLAYGCKKDSKVAEPTADVTTPQTPATTPAWNSQFVGNYQGHWSSRPYFGPPPNTSPWYETDTLVTIGLSLTDSTWNTTSIHDFSQIHFIDSTGLQGWGGSHPYVIFEFKNDSLYYHSEVGGMGAGTEYVFRGKKTP